MQNAPLAGLKILDLSRVLAGPYCTLMFADLGAEVIKIEPPAGDETRRFGPPFVAGESTYFLSINRGKRSLVLDLKKPGGQRIAQELAQWADIVVQNFRPGDADKLGVGYARLAALNPRLVYVSISGYGQRGVAPYTTLPGYDLVIQGVGGIASLTGPADGPPFKVGTSVADLVAGLNAFGGAMAALHECARTGRGQHVDISMLDGQLSLLTYQAGSYLHTGNVPERLGNAHPSICPYETFTAADGHLNIACGNDTQFVALCRALQHPELAARPEFGSNAARVENRQALTKILQEILATQPVAVWLERVQAAGVPCGPIYNVAQALAHPQAAARGMVHEHDHPTAGRVRSVGTGMGFGPPEHGVPPPRLGQHSEEVLREILGYDSAAIASALGNGDVKTL